MIDVYICEDNVKQLNMIKKHIQNAIKIEETGYKYCTGTGEPHDQPF